MPRLPYVSNMQGQKLSTTSWAVRVDNSGVLGKGHPSPYGVILHAPSSSNGRTSNTFVHGYCRRSAFADATVASAPLQQGEWPAAVDRTRSNDCSPRAPPPLSETLSVSQCSFPGHALRHLQVPPGTGAETRRLAVRVLAAQNQRPLT